MAAAVQHAVELLAVCVSLMTVHKPAFLTTACPELDDQHKQIAHSGRCTHADTAGERLVVAAMYAADAACHAVGMRLTKDGTRALGVRPWRVSELQAAAASLASDGALPAVLTWLRRLAARLRGLKPALQGCQQLCAGDHSVIALLTHVVNIAMTLLEKKRRPPPAFLELSLDAAATLADDASHNLTGTAFLVVTPNQAPPPTEAHLFNAAQILSTLARHWSEAGLPPPSACYVEHAVTALTSVLPVAAAAQHVCSTANELQQIVEGIAAAITAVLDAFAPLALPLLTPGGLLDWQPVLADARRALPSALVAQVASSLDGVSDKIVDLTAAPGGWFTCLDRWARCFMLTMNTTKTASKASERGRQSHGF